MTATFGIEGCIISINVQSSTEIITECGDSNPLEGPTIETLNFTAYPQQIIWSGEQSKAGVSINYIRKYDCLNDVLYFIANGQGQSYIYGDPYGVSLNFPFNTTKIISAVATAHQSDTTTEINQLNGFGLTYTGDPISIQTTDNMQPMEVGDFGPAYLQNFTYEAKAGQPPKVSYTFVKGVTKI